MCAYKAIKVNGKKIDEHRYIMEQYLGRKLEKDEVVHHKDGNKRNNNIENLELTTRSKHSREHQLERTITEETKQKLSVALMNRPNLSCRKFSDADVLYIKEHYIPKDKEFGCRALARKFGVSHSIISDLINERTYKSMENVV